MGGLLVRNNALVVKDGKLVPADDSACCCEDTRYAVNFAECCDGNPVLWILETLIDPTCDVVMLGGTCYRRAGGRALVSELQAQGIFVYLYWYGVCVPLCNVEPCRECPSDCCVYGFLPECERFGETPTPGQCCPLGSVYRLTYTETYSVEVSGVAAVAACSADGIPERCRGYNPGLVSRYTLTVAATEQWSGSDRFGIPCNAESFTHTRTERRVQFTSDGYTYPPNCEPGPIPINPRYETTANTVNVPSPLFGRGVLPSPYYRFDRANGSIAVYQCNLDRYTPYDVATCSQSSESVASVYGCAGGQSILTADVGTYTCCGTQGTELETVTRIRGERRWTIEVLGRNGCESNPCEGSRPGGVSPGVGDDGRRPGGNSRAGGCSGCRGEQGL